MSRTFAEHQVYCERCREAIRDNEICPLGCVLRGEERRRAEESARKKWESFVESVVESGGIGLPDEAEVCGCPHGYKKGSCPVCGG